jgi:hypothetical protein
MPRARWFVVGFLLTAGLVGGVLNERGPFDQPPSLSYTQFLADSQAGDVEQIVQWRDRLEVTEADQLLLVTVPPDRDLTADLAHARLAGNAGISWAHIPDAWLSLFTPWVPFLILVAAALIWVTGIVRNRRAGSGSSATGSPQPAG